MTFASGALALGLLSGCASGPAGGSPGLGGSDGEDPGASRDGTRTPITLQIQNEAIQQNGSTIRLVQRGANCMRDELRDRTWTLPAGIANVEMGDIFTGSAACLTETSWATWDLTVAQPDGRTGTTVLEIGQSGLQTQGFEIEAKCWGGGTASCTGSIGRAQQTGLTIQMTIRLDRLPDPAGPTSAETFCSMEGGFCDMRGVRSYLVAFGVGGSWVYEWQDPKGFTCQASAFSKDPAPGTVKACFTYRL